MIITDHARLRFKQRWKKGGTVEEVAQQAFKDGKDPNDKQLKYLFNLGIMKDGYWTARFKFLGKLLFVFQKSGSQWILVTVRPLYKKRRRVPSYVKKYRKGKRGRGSAKYLP